MELKFLGRGSAFNPKEGNTSAYFVENNKLFLIDCGESNYERISKIGLLENIDEIYLMITHTHSDHIGSIGTLAMHSWYINKKPINIIISKNTRHTSNIEQILINFGCEPMMYHFVDETTFDNKFNTFQSIRYIPTKHKDNLHCYGILFTTPNGIVYYSGDTCDVNAITDIIDSNEKIDKLYVDTTTDNFVGNVHLFIGDLAKAIPNELKTHVYCMHINNDNCIYLANELGLNVVETIDSKKRTLTK